VYKITLALGVLSKTNSLKVIVLFVIQSHLFYIILSASREVVQDTSYKHFKFGIKKYIKFDLPS